MVWLRYCLLWGCVLLFAGCNAGNHQAPHEVVFAISQAPITLDPRYATDAASERVNRLIYVRLVEFDKQSRVVPGIATWQQKTPREYIFTLLPHRSNFHHGLPLTAEDVKATYASLVSSADSPHAAEFQHVRAIRVLSPETLVFHLSEDDRHFPEKLIIGILPRDLIQLQHNFARHPIGSGPMKFVEWKNSLRIMRLRDGLTFRLMEVRDPTVRVLKLKRGEADLLQGDLPPELVRYLQKEAGITITAIPGVNFSYLGLNCLDPVLRQYKVRKALAYAIDREAIIQEVMVPHSRQATMILPPEHYAGNRQLAFYSYNPSLARKYLKEAGVTLPLHLVYKTSTDAQRLRFATILQAQMREAGIHLEIKSLDWGTFFEDVKKGQFQLYGLTWVGIKTPDIYIKAFGKEFFPPKGFNRGRYQDPELDHLLLEENWSAATRRINERLPYIPLWYEGQFSAYNQRISQYSPQPDGNWDGLTSLTFSSR